RAEPHIIFILVLPCLLLRRVTRTLLSTRRCAPLVRRGARRQRPSFQIRLLLSDWFHSLLKPTVRAPSPDTYPPLPFPLLCHLTSRPHGQCAVGQSVPPTIESSSVWAELFARDNCEPSQQECVVALAQQGRSHGWHGG